MRAGAGRGVAARLAAGLALGAGLGLAGGAWGQETLHTPVLMDSGATKIEDQKIDARLGDLPMARADRTLKMGRDVQTRDAVFAVQVKEAPPEPTGARVRARKLLDEDRARVKREAAINAD